VTTAPVDWPATLRRHRRSGDRASAGRLCRAWLVFDPGALAGFANLALVGRDEGRADDAVRLIRCALRLDAGRVDLWQLLLACRLSQGASLRDLRAALVLSPDDPALMDALAGTGDDAAIAVRTLRLSVDALDRAYRMAARMRAIGRPAVALALLRAALAAAGNAPAAITATVRRHLLQTMLYVDDGTAETRFADRLALSAPDVAPAIRRARVDPDPGRRLRIGYVSGDWRDHPVSEVFWPLVTRRDAAQIETYCYASFAGADRTTRLIRAYADHWREIAADDDDRAARRIADDAIDILVMVAPGLEANRSALATRRPAPIVMGFADVATSGLVAFDYLLSERGLHPPGATEWMTERALHLPTVYAWPEPHEAPPVSPLPMLSRRHPTFGCCANPAKIGDETLDVWAAVLRAVPDARLLLKFFDAYDDPVLATRMRRGLAARGIDAGRIELRADRAVKAHHLATYQEIDVALDTYPFAGSTTSKEALWMGVPLVTLAGATQVSRWGVHVLDGVGRPAWIARSPEAFADITAALVRDPVALGVERAGLRSRMLGSRLMNARAWTRHVERLYRAVWRRWCATEACKAGSD
jgi:predicted O-linked N-acetylglucosamine transferase (SPINDLY family)